MRIILKDIKNAELNLAKANEKNRMAKMIDNNYVLLSKKGDNVTLTSLVDDSYIADFNTTKLNKLFSYRNQYIGYLDCSNKELEIVTSIRLHGHSGYSLLDGMVSVKDIANKVSYSSALTDHGVLHGSVEFYTAMKELHKKAIIGFEAYTYSIDNEPKKHHLVLIAKNEIGYKNLVKLCSLGQGDVGGKFPYRPLITHDQLKKHHNGVICLSACVGGEIPKNILLRNYDKAKEVAKEFKKIFGNDFYIEIQRHNIESFKESGMSEEELNEELIKLAKELNIKIVATDDAHYLDESDALIHEGHICNQQGKTMSDTTRWKFNGDGYHVHTVDEMEKKFKDLPEALINTLEIMDKCNFEFKFAHSIEDYHLPEFKCPDGLTEDEYLIDLCKEGFNKRFPIGTVARSSKEYKERLEFEISVITKMGYSPYFLIVSDFIKWAKSNGVSVGPGRGSACGSLAAYCLFITDMDPIPYNLLFERFLSPDRISMPDIDTDFEDLLRDMVIEYCRTKYGYSSVSKIVTFTTLATKQSILDAARIWDKPVEFGRKITKLIPQKAKNLKDALATSTELSDLYSSDEEVKDIVDKAIRFEGLPKSASQHACGIVISKGDITDYVPITYVMNKETGQKEVCVQYNMTEVEHLGLLKMDFLGLKTMSVLHESVKDVVKLYGIDIEIDNIPINDPFVYESLSKGNTVGVFQLESAGMTSFITQLFQDVPNKIKAIKLSTKKEDERKKLYAELGDVLFERLIAGISLYRPGPMDEIPKYLQGMLNPEKIVYDTPELEHILNTTYGVTVFQEQVMLIVRELAGFTKGQADTIRKAMGRIFAPLYSNI